jgi:hypothetical protein
VNWKREKKEDDDDDEEEEEDGECCKATGCQCFAGCFKSVKYF